MPGHPRTAATCRPDRRVLRRVLGALLAAALPVGLLVLLPPTSSATGARVIGTIRSPFVFDGPVIGTLSVTPAGWRAGDEVRLTLDYDFPVSTNSADCGLTYHYGGRLLQVGWSFGGADPEPPNWRDWSMRPTSGEAPGYRVIPYDSSFGWNPAVDPLVTPEGFARTPKFGPGEFSVTTTAPSSGAMPWATIHVSMDNPRACSLDGISTSAHYIPTHDKGLEVTVAQSPEKLIRGKDNDGDGDVDDDDAILAVEVTVANVGTGVIEDIEAVDEVEPVKLTHSPGHEDAMAPIEEPIETEFGTLQPGQSRKLTYRYEVSGQVDAEAEIAVRGLRGGQEVLESGTGRIEAGQVIAPVVFLPGVLGSEIWCVPGAPLDRIWPPALGALESPGTFGRPVQEQMMLLTADGTANASAECPNAGPRDAEYDAEHNLVPGRSGVVESVAGVDAYGSGMRELVRIVEPESFYAFGWDWRKDTSASLDRLDALVDQAIEDARENQEYSDEDEDPKVQLVAHSYGGLLALDYASDPARRDKLERVTTVGTPYLGAPKTAFSLLTGTETAISGGWDQVKSMQTIFGGTNDVRSFSTTARGLYNLWPAASYGRFLDVAGVGSPMGDGQIRSLIAAAGGVPALWDSAQAKHAALWDRLDIGDLPWHLVVSGGVPTLSRVRFEPGGAGSGTPLTIGIELAAGDGTVPLRSQTLLGSTDGGVSTGSIGGTHGELSVGELCAVQHGSQMADPALYAQIEDWLLLGDTPTSTAACRAQKAVVIDAVGSTLNLTAEQDQEDPSVPDPFAGLTPSPRLAAAQAAGPAVLAVEEAVRTGLATVLRAGDQALILLDPDSAVSLRLDPAPGKRLRISTSLVDGKAATSLAGPVAGSGSLYVVADGSGGAHVTSGTSSGGPGPRPPYNVCTAAPAASAGAKTTTLTAKPVARKVTKRARAKVAVTATYKAAVKGRKRTLPATGTLVVCDGAAKLVETKLKKGRRAIKLPRLAPGKHKLTVRYLGSGKATPKDRTVTIKVARK